MVCSPACLSNAILVLGDRMPTCVSVSWNSAWAGKRPKPESAYHGILHGRASGASKTHARHPLARGILCVRGQPANGVLDQHKTLALPCISSRIWTKRNGAGWHFNIVGRVGQLHRGVHIYMPRHALYRTGDTHARLEPARLGNSPATERQVPDF